MKTRQISAARLVALRGKRSREVIAHEMRNLGHATDAKAIWRYETGRSQPRTRIIADLASVLGVPSVDELFTDDEEEESSPMPAEMLDDLADALLSRLLQRAARS